MFKNYLKIALRNIHKYKGSSFVNIAGLAIGITCCLLIISLIHQMGYCGKHHCLVSSILFHK